MTSAAWMASQAKDLEAAKLAAEIMIIEPEAPASQLVAPGH
jgi:hypothetical protein